MPITEDISQPGEVHGVGVSPSCVTLKFSPPGKSLMLALVTAYTQSAGAPSLSVSDSGSHTWTLGPSRANGRLLSAIYYTYLTSAPGSITMTATDSSGQECVIHLTPRVLNGCTSTQSGQKVNNNGYSRVPQEPITPGSKLSTVYIAALMDAQQATVTPLSTTFPSHTYNISEIPTCHLAGRSLTGTASAENLGWTVSGAANWALSAMEIQNADVPISSADTGTGGDTSGVTVKARVPSSDAGTGLELIRGATGTGAALFMFSTDTGHGTDATGVITQVYHDLGSTDAGAGVEGSVPPPLVRLPTQFEFGTGSEFSLYPPLAEYPSLGNFGPLMEGFSLDRAAMLNGATGVESGQLYAAQQITITPDMTVTDLMSDDYHYGMWVNLNKAALQVTEGFLPFTTLASMTGLSISSFGASPLDYYAMPLWTQYQHNRKAVPMAFRMQSRDGYGHSRALVFVLYAVQLAVMDFTGTVYKTGLGVSYSGTVVFSSVDEVGNALGRQQIGRIVSQAGNQVGALSGIQFQGS